MKEKFKRTIGHQKQKDFFLGAIEKNRLGHAYALAGPSGLGKTTFVLDLAEIFGAEPTLDVFLYDDGGFGVDQARELQRNIRLKSSSGGLRVAVIAKAESMTHAAANSILKLLEEPPANSVIFLITSNFHNLIPTVASRVQKVNFGKVSDEELKQLLRDTKEQEEILNFAKGRPGVALELSANLELLDFYRQASQHYVAMETENTTNRLLAAQDLSALESARIKDFFVFAMREWFSKGEDQMTATGILNAFFDQQANLNSKLAVDNAFLK